VQLHKSQGLSLPRGGTLQSVLLRKSQEQLLPLGGTLWLGLLHKSEEMLSHGGMSLQVLQHKSLALQSRSLEPQHKSPELTYMLRELKLASAQPCESLVHPQQVRLAPWPMSCS